MIFVVELAAPRVWFAWDDEDLLHKLAAQGALDGWRERDCESLRELLAATLAAREATCVYWTEAEATAAFERADDPAWQAGGWRARWALREQLVALDVLADDL